MVSSRQCSRIDKLTFHVGNVNEKSDPPVEVKNRVKLAKGACVKIKNVYFLMTTISASALK